MNQTRKIASAVAGFGAALLVAGAAVFAPTTAFADDNYGGGTVTAPPTYETPTVPGGEDSIIVDDIGGAPIESLAPGGDYLTVIRYLPNTPVTLTVTSPGGAQATIEVAASVSRTITTNDDGYAIFRVRIPAGTPDGDAVFAATNTAGAAIPGFGTVTIAISGTFGAPVAHPPVYTHAPAVVHHPAAG